MNKPGEKSKKVDQINKKLKEYMMKSRVHKKKKNY